MPVENGRLLVGGLLEGILGREERLRRRSATSLMPALSFLGTAYNL